MHINRNDMAFFGLHRHFRVAVVSNFNPRRNEAQPYLHPSLTTTNNPDPSTLPTPATQPKPDCPDKTTATASSPSSREGANPWALQSAFRLSVSFDPESRYLCTRSRCKTCSRILSCFTIPSPLRSTTSSPSSQIVGLSRQSIVRHTLIRRRGPPGGREEMSFIVALATRTSTTRPTARLCLLRPWLHCVTTNMAVSSVGPAGRSLKDGPNYLHLGSSLDGSGDLQNTTMYHSILCKTIHTSLSPLSTPAHRYTSSPSRAYVLRSSKCAHSNRSIIIASQRHPQTRPDAPDE